MTKQELLAILYRGGLNRKLSPTSRLLLINLTAESDAELGEAFQMNDHVLTVEMGCHRQTLWRCRRQLKLAGFIGFRHCRRGEPGSTYWINTDAILGAI